MTDQHPIASPPRLADAALTALGEPLDPFDCWSGFRVISPADYARIRAALERLKQLESYLD
jgi:hypothetical protein